MTAGVHHAAGCARAGRRSRRARLCARLAATIGCGLLSCSADAPTTKVHSIAAPLVYGDDDRREYFEVDEPVWRDRLARSTLAMVHRHLVTMHADGAVSLAEQKYGELHDVCPGEPFWEQPSAPQCSGVLIDRTLMLTAAHCVRNLPCKELRLVSGFYYDAPNELHAIRTEDVYACHSIAVMNYSRVGSSPETEYAVVLLDRPVDSGLEPAPVFLEDEPLEPEQPITIIGHGAGLPSKIDTGGRVADPRTDSLDYFRATFDAFAGNSGSGVYDADGLLRGVFVRGGADYEPTLGTCQTVRRVADEPGLAEEKVTYVARALDDLCSTPLRSSRVCGPDLASAGCALTQCGATPSARPSLWCLLILACLLVRRARRRRG